MNFMKKNGFCVLLGIVFILWLVIFNYEVKDLNNKINLLSEINIANTKKVNSIIELNDLDTDQYHLIFNSESILEEIKNATKLDINIPNDWQINSSKIKVYNNDSSKEFTLIINKGQTSFDNFTKSIYDNIKSIDDNGIVQSFNKRYYEINSFNEATYNNMYFDVLEDKNISIRHKIKITNLDKKEVKIEIDIF